MFSSSLNEVQRLGGRIATLSTFISRSAECGLPFFKTLRKTKNFIWDEECQQALEDLKTYVAELPLLTKLTPGKPPYLYLVVGQQVATLMEEDKWNWLLHTYGSSTFDGSKAGVVLTTLEGDELEYALSFDFKASNNETEYEALIVSIRLALDVGAKNLIAYSDSQQVTNQMEGK
ncbi:UNVERIFIED_CONTAM: hypothetical protein Sradi_2340700 [Sesamum radiatum]|uniref:RNase H type-1 domain-containing protein n=1 Tax=Sesamum radiatum TaxID=300843 RepID=A0AAW2T5H2_SESRA